MSADPGRKKIFVLDDDPEMQIFLSNLLNSAGYQPVIFENGAVELDRIAVSMPALMILCVIKYRDNKTRLYMARYRNVVELVLAAPDGATLGGGTLAVIGNRQR